MRSEKLDDWMGFFEELNRETQRGAAVIGAAWLDKYLERLIGNYLVDDQETWNLLLNSNNPQALITSFGYRITVAYALGLIGKDLVNDLRIIKKIRNLFAHELHGIAFESPEVSELCQRLVMPNKLEQIPDLKRIMVGGHARYLFTVATLAQRLALKAKSARNNRLVPDGEMHLVLGSDVSKSDVEKATNMVLG